MIFDYGRNGINIFAFKKIFKLTILDGAGKDVSGVVRGKIQVTYD